VRLLTGLQAEAAYSQLPSVILTYSILLVFSVFAPYYNPFSSIMQEKYSPFGYVYSIEETGQIFKKKSKNSTRGTGRPGHDA